MSELEKFLATRSRNFVRVAANRGAAPDLRVLNAGGDEAQIYIYDVIDPWWGISAEAIRTELAAAMIATDASRFATTIA